MDKSTFRDYARNLGSCINQLQHESVTCISEILDYVEPAGGVADKATISQGEFGLDRLAERIGDVMSAYDSMLESLGRDKQFGDCIDRLNSQQ